MDSREFARELIAAGEDMRRSLDELDSQVRAYASAERRYRIARARAYLSTTGKTVGEREARTELAQDRDDVMVGDLRYARDLAEGLKVSALEAVRSARAQVSALQTAGSLAKAEADFIRTAPHESVGV